MRYLILTVGMIGLLFLVGCASQIANPASQYCTAQGGTLEMIEGEGGTAGVCVLADGTRCDEWQFYRGQCPKKCGECPLLSPPGPGFCPDGKIVQGDKDECGCQGPPKCEQVACTAEAKLCPDGSAVGRVAPDCEFAPCPASSCRYDDPTKDYKARSADECARIRFFCENSTEYFSDECGCGCTQKLHHTNCTPASREGDMCTLEYAPVCGWFSQNVKCVRYPCAIEAGNPCEACHNANVEYYTEGHCPP
jgi:hypothetical protein